MAKTETKYLSQYAEPEALVAPRLATSCNLPVFTHAIVIPAYDEPPAFLNTFTNNNLLVDTLIILVINTPESQLKCHASQELFATIERSGETLVSKQNLTLFQWQSHHLLVVDRFSQIKIPDKQGVGLARKIGCDIAIALHNQGNLKSPWIYSTDADVKLPSNYFMRASLAAEFSAQVFNFEHVNGNIFNHNSLTNDNLTNDSFTNNSCLVNASSFNNSTFNNSNILSDSSEAILRATQQYEQALKYYRRQLRWAGSSYGFYTLGSTLAVHTQSYCKVRGFPKRAGGEDFYLLNKLAKVGKVLSCDEITIKIAARGSHRVPFGTGPATQKIVDQTQQGLAYSYYHPQIFFELKTWLAASKNLWPLTKADEIFTALSPKCNHALTLVGLNTFLTHASVQCKTQQIFLKSLNDWFDGFITLKFIHALQAHYYSPLPLDKCIELAHQQEGPLDGY